MKRPNWIVRLLLAYGFATGSVCAQTCPAGDSCFGDSFETPYNFPADDAEAARFLNQITFGATAATISQVRAQGTEAWLEQQLNAGTTTLSRPWLEAYAAALPSGQAVSQDQRIHRWFDVAVNAPDQVRQRVAYALSQIVVASDRDGFLINEPIQMAEWNDILVRNALGNYRQLLQEVTYSPMMGRYLTTLRNRKFELRRNCAPDVPFCAGNNGVQPDENYAREIMQLFSIGLLVRGPDFFTTYPDSGNPDTLLSTYGEDDISTLARVFTGLSYGCTQGSSSVGGVAITRNCGSGGTSCTGIGCRFSNTGSLFGNDPPRDPSTTSRGLVHPDWYRPMVCYPRYNDNGRDQTGALLEDPNTNPNLPAGSPGPDKILVLGSYSDFHTLTIGPSFGQNSAPLNCNNTSSTSPLTPTEQQACVDYCEGNINGALDFLFNHPNLPVMVARQMIQRLVTSNPSPQYVQRVAEAFAGNMGTPRGDMKALIRAIVMDAEARRLPSDPAQPADFGKVREPMLKLVSVWRHFGAVSGDTAVLPTTNPQGGTNPLAGQAGLRRWGSTAPQDIYQQRPLGAPSVFNFYEPDYRQPGPVTTAGLYSPEFQIIHEVTSIATANDLYTRICAGYGSNNCSAGTALGAPGSTGAPADRAYFPATQIDLIPARMTAAGGPPAAGASPTLAEDVALIEFFNTRMMGGTMSGSVPGSISCPSSTGTGMKGLLVNLLRCSGGINEVITNGTQAERQRRKALYLMHLIAISPEYSVQR